TSSEPAKANSEPSQAGPHPCHEATKASEPAAARARPGAATVASRPRLTSSPTAPSGPIAATITPRLRTNTDATKNVPLPTTGVPVKAYDAHIPSPPSAAIGRP